MDVLKDNFSEMREQRHESVNIKQLIRQENMAKNSLKKQDVR